MSGDHRFPPVAPRMRLPRPDRPEAEVVQALLDRPRPDWAQVSGPRRSGRWNRC